MATYRIAEAATTSKTTYTATVWGDTYRLRADWAEAASPIERDTAEGGWAPTGWQVADYRHRPADAMRAELGRMELATGSDLQDERVQDEIDLAIAEMESE